MNRSPAGRSAHTPLPAAPQTGPADGGRAMVVLCAAAIVAASRKNAGDTAAPQQDVGEVDAAKKPADGGGQAAGVLDVT